jgi:hypothetical protein
MLCIERLVYLVCCLVRWCRWLVVGVGKAELQGELKLALSQFQD